MTVHYYKQTRYKLLRTFCVVAQKENITHAAEQLHISQPTVSLQIQALESSRAQLIYVPTEAGLPVTESRRLENAQ